MEEETNGDVPFQDLLTAALSQSGLDNLECEYGEEDELPAAPPQPQQVQTPLAQSTPVRNPSTQFITVRAGTAGVGQAQIISPLPTSSQTPVKVRQATDARTPVTTRIIKVPHIAGGTVVQRSAGGTPVTNGQRAGQKIVSSGTPGTSSRIFTISRVANGSGTKNIIVNPQTGTATPQNTHNIIVTPQGSKVGTVSRQIFVTRNGQSPATVANSVSGQMVLANVTQSPQQIRAVAQSSQQIRTVSPSPQQIRTISSPQILQTTGGVRKVLINQANGQVLQLKPQTVSTASAVTVGSRIIQVASPATQVQTRVIQSPSQAVVRTVTGSPLPEQKRIIQPSVGQLKSIGRSGSGHQLIISQSGLSGAKVISASSVPSPAPSTNSLHHTFSMPVLSKEGSRSRSNSPVFGMGNIPTVVSQKINVRNLGGGSSKDTSWSTEDMQLRAFYNASTSQRSRKIQELNEDAEEESEELGHAETYAEYMPRKVQCGLKHPDQVVESSSLSSVEPPDVMYRLNIPEHVIDEGLLSALQLEAITYACQRHEFILPSGERGGYLIGDGAGVGKGRTVAGIIYENYLQGRKRALWLSVSNDLKVDAERDLEDIGAKIKVYSLNKFKYAKISSSENGSVKKGVVFVTYSSLIGESSQSQSKYRTRIKQLLKWCGKDFDGAIVFDECHKAKNLCPTGSSKPTKTGLAVMELQNRLPKARIVYASATGATEPKNMAYMTRLGLWGPGTPFKEFNDFINSVEKRGVGAMELVAMDIKLRGMYIARQLSFKGVSFSIEEIPLDSSFQKIYNDSVEVWMEARSMFQKAADLIQADHRMRKSMWGQFWSAHQRFFKYLCISAKVPHCVHIVREAIKCGKCVVIGLQSTGEARTQELVEEQGGDLNDFVSTAKGVFQTLVEKHFPAADRLKTFDLLGLGSYLHKNDSHDSGLKRKRDDIMGQNKRAKLDIDSSDDDDDSSNSVSDFSDLDSDLDSSESESDIDFNPFGSGADSDDDMPWVKKSKKKKSNKAPKSKKKEKPKKKKKKKRGSGDEEDELCDKVLANMASMKKSASYAGFTNGSSDNDPDNQKGMHLALQIKTELVNLVEQLGDKLPPNTLDQLIDELGGPDMVAEMTGRKGRVVQNHEGIQYESRSEMDVPLEILNLKEKERFMDGEKDIAIISEAASSGISLQADRRVINQKRRVHITLELPWSADRAIQQFGRTHRSNQVSAPEYIFLISDLAGERRFASTVAKRLESLGALTHGDRRATESRDLSRFNIDNRFGRSALETVMKSVLGLAEAVVDPPATYTGEFFEDVKKALEGVGLISYDRGSIPSLEKDYQNISKFLNRLLGMRTDLQNALFDYFNNTLSTIILDAKRSGRWDMGILDLGSGQEVVQKLETQVFVGNTATNTAKTELSTIQVERGMAWEDALNIWRKCKTPEEGFYLSTQERNLKRTATLVVLQGRNKKKEKVYSIYRPNTGLQSRGETLDEIKKKYKKVMPDEGERWWKEQYITSAKVCTHAYWNGNCRKVSLGLSCEVGLRTRRYHVLSGSVLSAWTSVETVLNSIPGGNMSKMQIVRLKTGDGQKIVGSLIPSVCVPPLINVLTKESAKTYVQQHRQTLQAAINGLHNSHFPSLSSSHNNNGVRRPADNLTTKIDIDNSVDTTSENCTPVTRAPETMLSMPVFDF